MHKYILIPDSFKGTLSARDFCAVAREAIGRADPGAQVLSIPLADGGEGTVEAFLAACGGLRIECPCTGPYGGTAPGFYGLLPDGTAVVELAAAAGLCALFKWTLAARLLALAAGLIAGILLLLVAVELHQDKVLNEIAAQEALDMPRDSLYREASPAPHRAKKRRNPHEQPD